MLLAYAAIARAQQRLGIADPGFVGRARRAFTGAYVDRLTGLPGYAVEPDGRTIDVARGVGLSMMLVWAHELWPDLATSRYHGYTAQFWQERWGFAGFRELRAAMGHPVDWAVEVDAGPVLAGFGTAASGFGLAAAADPPEPRRCALHRRDRRAVCAAPVPRGAWVGLAALVAIGVVSPLQALHCAAPFAAAEALGRAAPRADNPIVNASAPTAFICAGLASPPRPAGAPARRVAMKFAGMYLVGFLILIGGVLAALWKLGILASIGTTWTVIALVIVVGVGIMFSVANSGTKENIEIDRK